MRKSEPVVSTTKTIPQIPIILMVNVFLILNIHRFRPYGMDSSFLAAQNRQNGPSGLQITPSSS